jgi:hypothetical protein
MSKSRFFLLCWFLIAAAPVWGKGGNADLFFDDEFIVFPYFYVLPSKPSNQGTLALGWSYKPERSPNSQPYPKPTVKVFQGERVVKTIKPSLVGRMTYQAVFSGLTEFTGPLTYHLDGFSGRRPLPLLGDTERESISFWFISDHHLKSNVKNPIEEMGLRMTLQPADFVLNGGDILDTKSNRPESLWIEMLRKFATVWDRSTFLAALGNHDRAAAQNERDGWGRFLGSRFRDAYYSFTQGPVRFIVLNSNVEDDPELLTAQQVWITQVLESSRSPWTVVLSHHPPESGAFYDKQLEQIKEPKGDSKLLATSIGPLLAASNSRVLWLAGDVHYYQMISLACGSLITAGPAGGSAKILERLIPHESQVKSWAGGTMTRFEIGRNSARALTYDLYGNLIMPEFSIPFERTKRTIR